MNEKTSEFNSPFLRNNDIEMKIPPKIIESESPFARRAQTEEIESDEATLSPDFGGIPQQNAPQIVELPSMSINPSMHNQQSEQNEANSPFVRQNHNEQMMEIDDEQKFERNSINFDGEMLANIVKKDEVEMSNHEDVPKLSQKMGNVSVSDEGDGIQPLSLDDEASENEKNYGQPVLLLSDGIIFVQSVYPFDPEFYNVIDVTPNCYTMGLCTEYGEWGKSIYSVHPSSEERTLHLLRNMARLFPTAYKRSKYGARQWGYKGSEDWDWDDGGYCGKAAEYPAYWYSMGNQAARWHQWDKFTCNKNIGHETCSNPNRCPRFGSCSFSGRSKSFIPLGGVWAKAEGMYGMNSGYDGGHCSAIFHPDYKYFGVGYWPSMSSSTTLYIKNGPPRDYPIYMGSHLDETSRIPADYHNAEGKHLTFLLGWYGNADTINKRAESVYLLYDAQMIEMNVLFGDASSGIYEAHSVYPMNGCEPYAFVVIADDETIYRLPEQSTYFYGTSWVELEKGVPNKPGIHYPKCSENHYYRDERLNNQWIANGAQNLSAAHITYIKQKECVGCHKVNTLVDVYNDFLLHGVVSAETIFKYQPKIVKSSTAVPTLHPTLSPSYSQLDPLDICKTSGERGYEVIKQFKVHIKSDSDEEVKEDKIGDSIDTIISDNAQCGDYAVSTNEEWVRTNRVQITITICFRCIKPENLDAKEKLPDILSPNYTDERPTKIPSTFFIVMLGTLLFLCLCSMLIFQRLRRQKKVRGAKLQIMDNDSGDEEGDESVLSAVSPMSEIILD